MYSVVVDGKVLDYRFKKFKNDKHYNFYVGDIFIGQIFSLGKKDWAPVTFHTVCPYKNIRGFRTRLNAAEFMLEVCGFNKEFHANNY